MLKSKSSVTLEQSYDLLGLNQSASIDEIKQVYRQKAKAIHPDLNPDDVDAIDRFNTLNQAYQLLLDAAIPKHEFRTTPTKDETPSRGAGRTSGKSRSREGINYY
jgi:DnaJ-class molecular chaperone